MKPRDTADQAISESAEIMITPAPTLMVSVADHTVCVKIAGRANFTASVDFKALIHGLARQGQSRFVLDLTDCLLMDSTFLGVLAGLGLKFSAEQNGQGGPSIELLHPNSRITDLLDNLGIAHLFVHLEARPAPSGELTPVVPATSAPDKKEISRTCLEAHRTLMDINPANVPKFKDVAKFLAEDLKRLEEGK